MGGEYCSKHHIDGPARFGPFHRTAWDPHENDKVVSSGYLWGRVKRYIYQGQHPAAKAYCGLLPSGTAGLEFWTDVRPSADGVPHKPEWYEDEPGVITIERNVCVAIPVTVTKVVAMESANAISKAK
jgi:hypothetical protein